MAPRSAISARVFCSEPTQSVTSTWAPYLLSERRYGSFHRTIPLPAGADAEQISAELSNGVLTVTIPKTAAAKAAERKIEVKAA